MEVCVSLIDHSCSTLTSLSGGKSAVLSAITIALGGKTISTGRGNGLKAFIREGQRSYIYIYIFYPMYIVDETYPTVPLKLVFSSRTKETRHIVVKIMVTRSSSIEDSQRKVLRLGRSEVKMANSSARKEKSWPKFVII